jgi:hypothetical protein
VFACGEDSLPLGCREMIMGLGPAHRRPAASHGAPADVRCLKHSVMCPCISVTLLKNNILSVLSLVNLGFCFYE